MFAQVSRHVGDRTSKLVMRVRFPSSAPWVMSQVGLADLVDTIGPKLAAASPGMNPEGVMLNLAEHVDPGRLPEQAAR
jgi:hypothetical protein